MRTLRQGVQESIAVYIYIPRTAHIHSLLPTLQNLRNFLALYNRGFHIKCSACWVVVTRCRRSRYWRHSKEHAPMIHCMGEGAGSSCRRHRYCSLLQWGSGACLRQRHLIWGLACRVVPSSSLRGVGAVPRRILVLVFTIVYFVRGLNELVMVFVYKDSEVLTRPP